MGLAGGTAPIAGAGYRPNRRVPPARGRGRARARARGRLAAAAAGIQAAAAAAGGIWPAAQGVWVNRGPAPPPAPVVIPARNAPLYNDTAIYQGMAERDALTQQLINGMRVLNAQLPSAHAPTIGNQPNGRMSMQFGSTFMKDRRIVIDGGRIETNGSRVTITARKTPGAVTRITAFLTTEFPFGGKVGGVFFALVGLIPRVVKGLPGTVVITS